MKRILALVLALALAFPAAAQYVQGPLHRKGTHLASAEGRLSEAEMAAVLADIDGVDCTDPWHQAARGRNTGLGLTIGGAVTGVTGCVLLMGGVIVSVAGGTVGAVVGSIGGEEGAQQGAEAGVKAGQPLMTAGCITGAVGLGAFCVGVPMLVSGNRKMNAIVDRHNNAEPQASLSFGATAHGVGLRLTF